MSDDISFFAELPEQTLVSPGSNGSAVEKWMTVAQQVVSHKLVRMLMGGDAEELRDGDMIENLMDELRSFVPLKVQLESMLPPAEDLEDVHASLNDYARRILLAANQAIHNNISAIKEESRLKGGPLNKVRSQTEPHRRMLLDWQLRRAEDARRQFRETVEKVDGPNKETLERLGL